MDDEHVLGTVFKARKELKYSSKVLKYYLRAD